MNNLGRSSDDYKGEKANSKNIAPSLNPKYTFDNFVVGKGNRFAHAACFVVAQSPGKLYNPLFIYGEVGLGKTRLIQAVGNYIIQSNPKTKVLYVSAVKFINELFDAIQGDRTVAFRDKYCSVDVLLIDDIQFLAGEERSQEEFFHIFNTLYEANKQIVITSDRQTKDIANLEERLISCFEWGLVTDIDRVPDYETRIYILRKKSQLENLNVPAEVITFIAEKIIEPPRELENALTKLTTYSTLNNKELSVPLAQEVLIDKTDEVIRDMKKSNHWKNNNNGDDSERASIIRALLGLGKLSEKLDPWLPFPQNSCCYSFGKDKRPIPVGALLILWEKHPLFTGRCPECNGKAFGYAFGGLFNIGGIVGCCIECKRKLFRHVGGLMKTGGLISPFLKDTPYSLNTSLFGGAFKGPREPLLTALRELGIRDIPDEEWALGSDPPGVSLTIKRKMDETEKTIDMNAIVRGCLAAIKENSNDAIAYHNLGFAYFQLKRYKEALDSLKQSIKLRPNSAVTYNTLGIVYTCLTRYEESIAAFKQAINLNPDYADAYHNLGMGYGNLERYAEAIPSLKQAILQNPDNFLIYDSLGEVYNLHGCYEESVILYKQAIKLGSEDPRTYYNLGITCKKLKRYEEAINSFKQAIKIKPGYTKAYNELGLIYGDLGRYEESIIAFKQAIQLNPNFTNAFHNLGVAYENFRHYEEAATIFRQAIKMDPDNVNPYIRLGFVCKILGYYEESINAYKQAIKLEPGDAKIYHDLGSSYFRYKHYEESIAAYKQVIKLEPDSSVAYHNLGLDYDNIGCYEEAINAYKQAIKLDPNSVAETYYNLGLVYGRLKRYEEEISAYKQAIKLDPNYTQAYYNLSGLYGRLKRYDESISICKQAIKLNPNDALSYNNLGVDYSHLKRYEEAIKAYKQAIKLDPDNAGMYYNLGIAYDNFGCYEEAITAYKQANKLDPNKFKSHKNF